MAPHPEWIKESEKLKKKARNILDKYSYEELLKASEDNIGNPELIKCLRDILLSIIEDWIQDYFNERELAYETNKKLTIS